MEESLLSTVEEQVILGFTGKINLIQPSNGQILGCFYLISGEVVNVKYKGAQGIKAFYNACIESLDNPISTVTEPEIIDARERKINRPFSILKRKLVEITDKTAEAKENRPPNNLKLLTIPSILTGNSQINSSEFSVLCTLSDYNKVADVYNNNPLLDYEITNALVGLRLKGAIKVVLDK